MSTGGTVHTRRSMSRIQDVSALGPVFLLLQANKEVGRDE